MRKLLFALLLLSTAAHAQPSIQRVAVGGTLQVFQPKLNLIGSGIGIGCANNTSTRSQDCTFSATTPSAVSLAATVGTLNLAIISQDANDLTYTNFVPATSGNSSWFENFSQTPNTPGPRPDLVWTQGWNIAPGGGRVLTGSEMGALSIHMEQYFQGSHHQMEFHNAFVDASDNETRFLSFLGSVQDTTNTLLDLRSNQINIGSGRSTAGPTQFTVTPTETKAFSPDGFNQLALDSTLGVQLYAGTSGTPLGSLVILPAGTFQVIGSDGYLGISGPQFQWHSSQTIMNSPDQGSYYQVANSDGAVVIGGNTIIRFQPTYYRVNADLYDATPYTHRQGDPSGPFKSWQGGDTTATQDSCDSSHRGTFQVIYGGSGVADTFQVCRKDTAGNYAWSAIALP